jgi:alpha-1,3-glucan synthase
MALVQEQIPTLRDGFQVERLSVASHNVFTPGSPNAFIDTGMWSSIRGPFQGVQDFSTRPGGNQVVWLIHSNENVAVNYSVGCGEEDRRRTIISPFPPGTVAKNLFYPYQEFMIEELQWTDKPGVFGCLPHLRLEPFSFMALVPETKFVAPRPSITHFSPGHDSRILSSGLLDGSNNLEIQLHFSTNMNCTSVIDSISIEGRTNSSVQVAIDPNTIECGSIHEEDRLPTELPSQPQGIWHLSAMLSDLEDGVYRLTVNNASDHTGNLRTMAKDHFLFRIGKNNNPVVFPITANYTSNLLKKDGNGNLVVSHKANGADKFRYSMNWGRTYSSWNLYNGEGTPVNMSLMDNESEKTWDAEHVIVEYCRSYCVRGCCRISSAAMHCRIGAN